MSKPRFHTLDVSRVRPQTEQAVAIRFAIPLELRPAYAFLPGQYVTLRAEVNGEEVRRCYSICSSSEDQTELEVGIKQVPDGKFSTYAHSLTVGDRLQVMTPQGQFIAKPGGQHRYLLIAAGSGITPCLSIIRSVLALEPLSTVSLLYGNQSTSTVMFREDLGALKDRYLSRFNVSYVMSRERQDVEFLNGRIDGARIHQLHQARLIDPLASDAVYLCGPSGMLDEVSIALAEAGLKDNKLHVERFDNGAGNTRKDSQKVEDQQAVPVESTGSVEVTIVLDGIENQFNMNPAKETVLQAAQRAGLDVPYSCAGGMCCTCRCKIADGDTRMDLNYSLADWEIEAGFTLACQSRPVGERLVLDFDAM